jgi:hypothetical protein
LPVFTDTVIRHEPFLRPRNEPAWALQIFLDALATVNEIVDFFVTFSFAALANEARDSDFLAFTRAATLMAAAALFSVKIVRIVGAECV